MRTHLQGLVNEVIGYGVGAAVNRGLGIIIACIYPILLNKDEYGRLDVIFSIPALIMLVFLSGIDSTMARFYYGCEEGPNRRQLVSTVFIAVMSSTLAAVGVLFAVSRPLAAWLYGDPRYIFYFRLALIAIPFVMASGIQSVVLRLNRRVRTYNIIAATNLIIAALVGISSILIFHLGAAGVLIGFVAGHMAAGIAGLIVNRMDFSAAPKFRRLPELLIFSLPLVLSGTALWFIGYVNRPILAHRVSADDVGLYAIAAGGVNMLALLIGAFRNAWQPFAFSIMGSEGSEDVYSHALTLFTAAGMTIAICVSLFSPQALMLINAYTHKNWSGAAPSVGPLAMGVIFSAMYFVMQTGIYISKRTSSIAWTMGIAALANIILNFLLIPRYGILGAAIATAAGHLIALIALYLVAQRIAPIPYHPARLITTILAAIAVIAVAQHFQTGSIPADLLLEFALLLSYGIVLLSLRIITFSDLKLFRIGIRSAISSIGNLLPNHRGESHADSH
jgi:O-antigen/teichoic acid export membrane protein